MKIKIRLSAVLALCVVLLLATLTAMSQVQRRPRRSAAIGAGGAGLYGVKSKTRKPVQEREQPIDLQSTPRRRKLPSRTKTSKPVVTTKAGQAQPG